MSERYPHVAVMDSGAGGLSVVRALRHSLPDVHLTYLADAAGCPYGERSSEDLISRVVKLARLVERGRQPDVLVVACNTASTVALPALRARLALPVVGVVPAIKTAGRVSRNRRIGLLATPATVNRPYVDALHHQFASDCELIRVGSSELVGLAERWLWHQAWPPADRLRRIVRPLVDAGVDTVVLGCTHFPLLRPMLQAALGPQVTLIDPSEAIARRVASLLNHEDGQVRAVADGASEAWITQVLAHPVSEPVRKAFQREGIGIVRPLLWPAETQTARNAAGRGQSERDASASDQPGEPEHGQELDERNGLAMGAVSRLHLPSES
ncbi:MAG: glutamate racemase [Gammaproteobacteria bacterium]|nr:MAG: glutamate racemase [Gammaproteobacteria bacterium]